MRDPNEFKPSTDHGVSKILGWGFVAISLMLAWSLLSLPAKAADSYTTNLRIVQQVPGSNDSTWGTKANAAFAMLDEAISKVTSVSVTAGDVTLTTANNATDQARSAVLILTGTPGVSRNVTAPNLQKMFYVYNNSDSNVVFKGGAGTTVTIIPATKAAVYTDGATNAAPLYVGPVGAVVGTTDTQTLTNKTIAGGSNTLSAIANASLSNSSITIGGASTALGGTVTATTILDSIGSTQGQILYRNGANWTILAPGSNGQYLTSGGAAANPSWTTGASGFLVAANNLSDVANAGTSRTNLGVKSNGTVAYSIATVGSGCHSGGASGDVCYEY